ncbi:MAG: lipase family protein [Cyanobacteria bacterium J06560_6]
MRRPIALIVLVASTWLIQPARQSARASTTTISSSLSEAYLSEAAINSDPIKVSKAAEERQWLLVLCILLASGAITWGVFKYAGQQKWQRIEFLRQAIKEFEEDPEILNALKILDFEEYRDYHVSAPEHGQAFSFHVTDELLCNALAKHDQRVRVKHDIDYHQDRNDLDPESLRQYQIETALRDWFNRLLNGLEHFGYFIESGLYTPKELQPWLRYWIKLIGDPVYRRPGASRFYDALYSYIHHSGFFGVQKLFERFGYRILPSPYQDNDLIALNLSSKFDTRVALTMAKASYLAYQDKQFVAEVVERWGNTLMQHTSAFSQQEKMADPKPAIKQTLVIAQQSSAQQKKNTFVRHNFRYFNNRGRDTQAYMFRSDQFMVLAFRGSQEPKDWLTNVTAQLRNFTVRKDGVTSLSSYQGRVHTGFFLAWASIENAVQRQIARWKTDMLAQGKPLPPLYITGHSLGGALATIAAAALSDNGIQVAGVYTFGQPRVGDRTFVNQLNTQTKGRVFRFVNNNDIVPHIPPPFSILNPTRLYGHMGTLKYFNAGGNIIANYKLINRIADSLWGLTKGALGSGFDMITDHSMEYYISHIDTALKEEAEDEAAHMLEIG